MHGTAEMPAGFSHFSYANPEAPKGGKLRQAAIGTFDTINPFSLKGKSAQGLNLAYDRLTARSWDEPFTLYPLIAEKIETPKDRSSISFTLNPKARFQDGSPILPEDVLFTFKTLKEEGRPNMRQVYKLVKKAEKIGENGVKFSLNSGFDQETVMILAMMPVLSEKWWKNRSFNQTILEFPLSSGPYRIEKLDPGRQIVFKRDPNYWAKDLPVNRGLYNFDEVVFDYYRDNTVSFEAFKTANIDVRTEQNPALWDKAYRFKGLTNGAARQESLKHGRVERMWGFIFNTRRPPFNDLRVRKALSLMLDYDWVNRNIFHGKYQTLSSYYPNSSLAASGLPSTAELALLAPFRDKLPPEVFGPAWAPPQSGTPRSLRDNLREADSLLKSAGWEIQKETRIQKKTGKPLRFEILLGSAEDEKVALAFKRALKRLGIEVSLRTLDNAAFRDRLNGYDFDLTLYFWQNTLSPGTEQLIYWGCDSAKQEGRFNYAGICHEATDFLAKSIPQVKTREELVTTTRALDRILTHEHYAIPLFFAGSDFVASWKPFRHPQKTPLYGNVIESWWYDENGIEGKP